MMLKSQDHDPLLFLSYNFIAPKLHPSIQEDTFCKCLYLQTKEKKEAFLET